MSDYQPVEFIKQFTQSNMRQKGDYFPPYTMCELCCALEKLGYDTEIVHDNWEDLYVYATKKDCLDVELTFRPYYGGWEIESHEPDGDLE